MFCSNGYTLREFYIMTGSRVALTAMDNGIWICGSAHEVDFLFNEFQECKNPKGVCLI